MSEEISNLSTLLDVPVSEVQGRYDEFLAKQPTELSEEARQELALNKTRSSLQAEMQARKKLVTYEGFFTGATEVRDFLQILRNKASLAYKENPQDAVLHGLTDGDGNVLDTREKLYGKPNSDFGMPLKPSTKSYNRVLYGVLRPNGTSENPTLHSLNFDRNLAPNVYYHVYDPCWFQAIPAKKQATTIVKLNASVATKNFHGMRENPFGDDIVDILHKTVRIVPPKELEAENERMGDADKERLCFTEGTCHTLSLEPSPKTGSRSMRMYGDGRDEMFSVFIPHHVEINFPEGAPVVVMGRLSMSKPREGRDPAVQMNAYGIYAKPKYRVKLPPLEERIGEQLAQEAEYYTTGWLPE